MLVVEPKTLIEVAFGTIDGIIDFVDIVKSWQVRPRETDSQVVSFSVSLARCYLVDARSKWFWANGDHISA